MRVLRSRWSAARVLRVDDQAAEYLDFTSGIRGQCARPLSSVWVEAGAAAGRRAHPREQSLRNPLQGELARQLVLRAGPGRVSSANSGAEANEALIKVARLHGVEKGRRRRRRCFKIIGARTPSTAGRSAG